VFLHTSQSVNLHNNNKLERALVNYLGTVEHRGQTPVVCLGKARISSSTPPLVLG
jgi:hypothetical protein